MDLRGKKVFGSWRKEQKVQGRDNINELLDTYEEGYLSFRQICP